MLTLGLPLAGSLVAQVGLGATDTLMMGRYGVVELAALTIATAYLFLLFMALSGFAWAAMPMMAEALAGGDEVRMRRVMRMTIWLTTAAGLLVLPLLLFSEVIFLLLGQSPEVAADAQAYLAIAGWAILPMLWVNVAKAYLSALERTGVILWATVLALPLNGLINYALIFGNWGLPEMGVQGAAVATLIVNSGVLVVLVLYARTQFPDHQLFVRLWRADWPVVGRVFRLGWPISITSISEAGLFSAAALLMGRVGTVELAAHGIAITLASLTFVMHLGISQAATVRAGRALGQRSLPDLHRAGRVSVALSLVMAGLTMALFLGLPRPLLTLFTDPADPAREAILATGVVLLAMAALFQLMDGAQVIALGLLRGLQDTERPMYIAAFSYWVVGMPTSYLLGLVFGWGAVGVWMGLVIGLAVAGALLMWRFWGNMAQTLPPAVPETDPRT